MLTEAVPNEDRLSDASRRRQGQTAMERGKRRSKIALKKKAKQVEEEEQPAPAAAEAKPAVQPEAASPAGPTASPAGAKS